ncbi:MAG: EpsI family protein [Candidatus Omnitrophica bacterium]|nr:hypothetical protein [bacterium]NUN98036.1 EpsI family protein [Candidatus Omnitrophota bacterium]
MNKARLVASVVLLAVTLVVNASIPEPGDHEPQGERVGKRIPTVLGSWTLARELPVGQDEKRILGTDDIFHRIYRNTGNAGEVALSLVFSSGHRHSMHPPEVCYQAGGYTLVSRGMVDIDPDGRATVLRLTRDADNQLVNYWFFSEGKETPNYIRHQIHLVINQVLFSTQPSVLIRLSTQIDNGSVEAAQRRLSDFAREALPILREKLSLAAGVS